MLLLHRLLPTVPLLGINLIISILGWHREQVTTEDTGILVAGLGVLINWV